MTKNEYKLMAQLQLKSDMFDYLCWLEQVNKPVEIKDEHLCMASDGTTCWGKDYATAVRVAMEYDKGLYDQNKSPTETLSDGGSVKVAYQEKSYLEKSKDFGKLS